MSVLHYFIQLQNMRINYRTGLNIKMSISAKYFFIKLLFLIPAITFSQGFLRTLDKEIVNDNGPVLLRGIGLGGWMLQEGYMLQTQDFANPQYQIRNKIEHKHGGEIVRRGADLDAGQCQDHQGEQ